MAALWSRDRKPRLLVIENDIDIGNMLKIYFRQWGADVSAVTRASEGLELFLSERFDLIILGAGLTDLGEDQFMRSLQASSKDIPVIILSARMDRSDKLKWLEAGADDYMIKPFDIEELRLRVMASLKRPAGDSSGW